MSVVKSTRQGAYAIVTEEVFWREEDIITTHGEANIFFQLFDESIFVRREDVEIENAWVVSIIVV